MAEESWNVAALEPPLDAPPSKPRLIRRPSTVSSFGSASSRASVHPLQHRERLLSCVQLLEAEKFAALPTPLPRVQDVPAEYFKRPAPGDQVISVSHAWQKQAHPDPTGHKSRALSQIISALGSENSEDSLLLFLDFISIPQRPFQAGQSPRSEDEVSRFHAALTCMHEMYFFSDRIIHLPWEPCKVPGEGAESDVPAKALEGADFAQVGHCVQITGLHFAQTSSVRSILRVVSGSQPHLFDEVLAVDGERVTSVEHLDSLLTPDAKSVRLRASPFGTSNTTPADARGWIFLERFITMVKCAMMDEEAAQKVVITPSSSIFREIMDGADRLRVASLRDSQGQSTGELKEVLDEFIRELQTKQFSATSTDKREMDSSPDGRVNDRDVVCGIMQAFVKRLAENWEAEAARQRSLGGRLKAAVINFMDWDCFSEEYTAQLTDASKVVNPWPLALSFLVPLAVSTAALVAPYASPDEGWTSQGLWWALGNGLGSLTLMGRFPVFLAGAVHAHVGRRELWRISAWIGCATVCLLGSNVALMSAWDTFPLPMTHFLGMPVAIVCLPFLFFVFSREERSSPEFQGRLGAAFLALMAMSAMFCLGLPALNALLPRASLGWQAVLVGAYLLSKLGFEVAAKQLSRRLGADAMPYFVYVATLSYQVNLCVALSMVSSWVIVAEQICFDVLENLYHLWSASRAPTARKEQYIVASLVLREFVELVVPAQYLVVYTLMFEFRPKSSALFCMRPEEEIRQVRLNLLMDIVVQSLVGGLTYRVASRRGHSPLSLLQGLVATRRAAMVIFAASVLLYTMTMQHSHWGMDFSFEWRWLFSRDAEWVCGLTWH